MQGKPNWMGIGTLAVTLALGTMWLKPWESSSPVAPAVPVAADAQLVAKTVVGSNAAADAKYFAACYNALADRVEGTAIVNDWETFKKLNKQFGTSMTAKKTKGRYPDLPTALEKYWNGQGTTAFSRERAAASCRSLAVALRQVKG